jgi:hypothetical protein
VIEVRVVPNALEPERQSVYHVEALIPWLMQRYGRWPETARLSHFWGKTEVDVTPATRADVASLEDLPGPFVVREYPAGTQSHGIERVLWGVFTLGISEAVRAALPDVPNVKTPFRRAQEVAGSPNNELGERSNVARPDERIPDIYGTVRAIPDLLAQPYTVYRDHRAEEIAYYCIGRGSYSTTAFRDGAQLVSGIGGASLELYPPGKAPTGGVGLHDPDVTIGDAIEDDVYTVYRVEAVNGQQLFAFRDYTFYGAAAAPDSALHEFTEWEYLGGANGRIALVYSTDPNEIRDRLEVGDELNVYWPMAFIPAGGTGTAPDLSTPETSTPPEPLEITGLTVTALTDGVDSDVLVDVTIPAAQQAQWALLATYFVAPIGPPAVFMHAQVTALSHVYAGPFFVDFEHPLGSTEFEVVCNFVAPQGLFQDDGTTALPLHKEIQVILTPASAGGSPTGASESFQGTLEGSAVSRGQRALTLRCKPVGAAFATSKRCLVRARLVTNSPRRERQPDLVETDIFGANLAANPPQLAYYSGRVVDEVRWVDCYSMSKPPNISFGDVTTVHTRTLATEGAVRIKDRKLNVIATRNIQTWDGATFGGPLLPSEAAENVLFSILKDPAIGNLPDASIDFVGIAAAFEAVRASVYDDSPLATIFAYTFDEADISLEETIQVICQACFCHAFRRGPVISARPELATDDSALVLNHRNIVKDSQRITHIFGQPTENDSVECGFNDPFSGVPDRVIVPVAGGTTLKPKRLNVAGIRTERQAYWHAYRAHHRMLYQRQSAACQVAEEAGTVGVRERVLMADLTRSSGVQDGEIVGEDGTTLRTSQRVTLTPGKTYTVFLQNPDRTVQSRVVASSPAPVILELNLVPSPTPIVDSANGVRTLYQLIANDEPIPQAFLVSSTQPNPGLTHDVQLVNYSHMYYFGDGLQTWVKFATSLTDHSPMRRAFTNSGGVLGGGLWTGSGLSYFEITPGTTADTATPSYTKFLWINASAPTESRLIESENDNSEMFSIAADNTLYGGHGGVVQVSLDYTTFLGAEHSVALTYDDVEEEMSLYVDGRLLDQAGVATHALTGLNRYLEGFAGTCRELMRWARRLSTREIMEVHLRTRP